MTAPEYWTASSTIPFFPSATSSRSAYPQYSSPSSATAVENTLYSHPATPPPILAPSMGQYYLPPSAVWTPEGSPETERKRAQYQPQMDMVQPPAPLGMHYHHPDQPLHGVANLDAGPQLIAGSGGISDFAAEMICYIWFSPATASSSTLPGSRPLSPASPLSSPQQSYPYLSPLQLPTPEFKSFVDFVLRTTLVSHSVIIISLLYIWRLRTRNPSAVGAPGSEYRLCGTSLMLANKFLDDNTYTSKTWSQVTGLSLPELNKMEVEMLSSLEYDLIVREAPFTSWLAMLDGFMKARSCIVSPTSQNVMMDPNSQMWNPYPKSAIDASFSSSQIQPPFPISSNLRSQSTSPIRNRMRFRPALKAGPEARIARSARRESAPYLQSARDERSVGATRRTGVGATPEYSLAEAHSAAMSRRSSLGPGSGAYQSRLSPVDVTGSVPPSAYQPTQSSHAPLPQPQQQVVNPVWDQARAAQDYVLSMQMEENARSMAQLQMAHMAHDPEALLAPYHYEQPRNVTPSDLAFFTLAASPMDPMAQADKARKSRRLGQGQAAPVGQIDFQIPPIQQPAANPYAFPDPSAIVLPPIQAPAFTPSTAASTPYPASYPQATYPVSNGFESQPFAPAPAATAPQDSWAPSAWDASARFDNAGLPGYNYQPYTDAGSSVYLGGPRYDFNYGSQSVRTSPLRGQYTFPHLSYQQR